MEKQVTILIIEKNFFVKISGISPMTNSIKLINHDHHSMYWKLREKVQNITKVDNNIELVFNVNQIELKLRHIIKAKI